MTLSGFVRRDPAAFSTKQGQQELNRLGSGPFSLLAGRDEHPDWTIARPDRIYDKLSLDFVRRMRC
jgi:hypothetical protein